MVSVHLHVDIMFCQLRCGSLAVYVNAVVSSEVVWVLLIFGFLPEWTSDVFSSGVVGI